MNYSLSIDPCSLKNSGVGTIKGKKCIIIPLEDNYITMSKNGRYYLNINMWEKTNRETGEPEPGKYGDSHYLKLSVSKETREAMTNEELSTIPFVGNAYPIQPKGEKPVNEIPVNDSDVEQDDLPF